MATRADVRRIALALPETKEAEGHFAFSVPNKKRLKGFACGQKDALLAAQPKKFFTEPHYNGFPAVLVRLPEVKVGELRTLLEDAWRCMAPVQPPSDPPPPRRKARSHTRT